MIRSEKQEDLLKCHVMHSLPGRLRVAAHGLQYSQEENGGIAGEPARTSGVRLAHVTPCTGGILLQYDAQVMNSAELAEQIELVLSRHAMSALRAHIHKAAKKRLKRP